MQEQILFGLWKDAEENTPVAPYLRAACHPWDILDELEDIIRAIGNALPSDEYAHPSDNVWIALTARISPAAHIAGPCIIGHNTELRPGAYLRGKVIIGKGAVIGNSTELKSCVLFDGAQVPHFNYVGDSILGHRAHLGAGAVTSNVKSDRSEVFCTLEGHRVATGRRKLGALIGDWGEIGCHTVLNPGTIVGRESIVYPCLSVRGYVKERCIYKGDGHIADRI